MADLTSEDIYRSLLSDHCTIGQYHDVFLWRDLLPVSSTSAQRYYLSYSTLSVTEGPIWEALGLLAKNEYASVWCERDSSIRVGPQWPLRGYEMNQTPTVYGSVPASQVLNAQTELNGNVVQMSRQVYQHFLFGPAALPQARDVPGGFARPNLGALLGPPVAFHLSDTVLSDPDLSPPADSSLLTQTVANWPQDLSIRPLQLQLAENYTVRSAFVKLVATSVLGTSLWSAWFPQSAFVGQSALTTLRLSAGTWDVHDSGDGLVLPDITIAASATAKNLAWNYLWEMARRLYAWGNKSYDLSARLVAAGYIRLGDLFNVTRTHAVDGPILSARPFYVSAVTHTIDLDKQTWVSDLSGSEVTSATLGPMVTPPFMVPS